MPLDFHMDYCHHHLHSAPRWNFYSQSCLVLLLVSVLGTTAASAEEQPVKNSTVVTAIAQLAAANTARAEIARLEAEWVIEQQRLRALISAAQAEQQRLESEAQQAEETLSQTQKAIATLTDDNALATAQEQLHAMGVRIQNGLTIIAKSVPPGTIATVPESTADSDLFDAAIRALDASERASETVSVEVVTGQRDGQTEAVKLLRVAGAAAWWVSLNGQSAGVAIMTDGNLHLRAVSNPMEIKAIVSALAQVEGRGQAQVVVVPR